MNALRQNQQPNFVIVMADQLTAPAVGAYGNSVVQTPHMDALGRDGVLFENAYCNSLRSSAWL